MWIIIILNVLQGIRVWDTKYHVLYINELKILPGLVEKMLQSFTVKLYDQEKIHILQIMKISHFFKNLVEN